VRFWDTSAVVPLLLDEPKTARVRALYREDPTLLVWWGTVVECASALARREREGALGADVVTGALAYLDRLSAHWSEVEPSDDLRATARRLLRAHNLRAADALQLAAATRAADGDPRTLSFVSLDERLAVAAQREGFAVVGPRD
jgi:predicted nucleic acid-binding protein